MDSLDISVPALIDENDCLILLGKTPTTLYYKNTGTQWRLGILLNKMIK